MKPMLSNKFGMLHFKVYIDNDLEGTLHKNTLPESLSIYIHMHLFILITMELLLGPQTQKKYGLFCPIP